jgi:hypothetical protein
MRNSPALIAFASLTQLTLFGCNAQTTNTDLKDIVPKREVLYVGGQYKNVTVSPRYNRRHMIKAEEAECCDEYHIAGHDRANLCREALASSSSR